MALATRPSAARSSPDVLIRATAAEIMAIGKLAELLEKYPLEEIQVTLGGQKQALPPSAAKALRRVVMYLARRNGVTLVPRGVQLTTQSAADLLGVSRPHLISLIERGEIRCKKVGTHRRLDLSDVLAFRDERIALTAKGLDQITKILQKPEADKEDPSKLQRRVS